MFSWFSFFRSTVKAGQQTRKHSRKSHDVFRIVRSNGLSIGQQRAAARIYIIKPKTKKLHVFTGQVLDGLPAMYSTNEPSSLMSQLLMTGLNVTFCVTRK